MSHTPHELHEEFPEFSEQIHTLKTSDNHFHNLAEKYHDLNRQIHRAETDVEPMEDLALTQLRKERLALKDEIFAMLRA